MHGLVIIQVIKLHLLWASSTYPQSTHNFTRLPFIYQFFLSTTLGVNRTFQSLSAYNLLHLFVELLHQQQSWVNLAWILDVHLARSWEIWVTPSPCMFSVITTVIQSRLNDSESQFHIRATFQAQIPDKLGKGLHIELSVEVSSVASRMATNFTCIITLCINENTLYHSLPTESWLHIPDIVYLI